MSRSVSARSVRSARSAYSTASHLLSPGTSSCSQSSNSPRSDRTESIIGDGSYSPTPNPPRKSKQPPTSGSSQPARLASPYWEDKSQEPSSSPLLSRRRELSAKYSTGSDLLSSASQENVSRSRALPRSSISRSSLPSLNMQTSDLHRTSSIPDSVDSRRKHLPSSPISSNSRASKVRKTKTRQGNLRSSHSKQSSSQISISPDNFKKKRSHPARRAASSSPWSSTSSSPKTPASPCRSTSMGSPSLASLPSATVPYRRPPSGAARLPRSPSARALGIVELASSDYMAVDQHDRYDQDKLNEVIMALDVDQNGKVGCAYYSAIDETLFLEEDVAMGGIETVETLLLHVEPTSLLIPNRASGNLVEFLERDAHRFEDDQASSSEQGSYVLRHLPSAQFDYEVAKEILAALDIGPCVPDSLRVESVFEETAQQIGSAAHIKLMRLAKIINLDSCVSIGCAGAVLTDLERRRTAEDLNPGNEGGIYLRVKHIKMNTSADTMLISADLLTSLQITQSELHPNPHMQSNGSDLTAKSSLSVVGLFQALASTAQGKRRLRQILLRPTTDISLIHERQTAISVFSKPSNIETTKSMRKLLRKLKDTKALFLHVRKGVDRVRGELSVRIRDWEALLRFVMVSVSLQQTVKALDGGKEVAILSKICHDIDSSQFIALSKVIMETFDFQASKESGHTHILPTASDCLGELRRQFSDVCQILPQLKVDQLQEIPKWAHKHIRECVLLKRMGFLLAVSVDPDTGEGVYHGNEKADDEWERVYRREDIVYYKTGLMRELTSQYGDLLSSISDEELAIVMEVADMVVEHEESITYALELFGELDSLLALSLAAEKYSWVAPEITASNIIHIVDGRHPLQDLLVPAFIPNSCGLAGGSGCSDGADQDTQGIVLEDFRSSTTGGINQDNPSMLILTGPNNSGKSVYMKQVALIVYLAHIGSFVPAARATIGLTDRILTRIATRETVTKDESAFMVDVKQAAFSMNFATRRSLLLIDEFGKGTTAENGSALLTAYLMYFLELGVERPKVLVGTHFHEIFESGLLEGHEGVAMAHMEVRLDLKAQDIEDQITFLHRMLPGRGPSSLGIMCAELNGIPSHVLDRAEDIVELLDMNEDLGAIFSLASQNTAEVKKARAVVKRFLEMPKAEFRRAGDSLRDMLREIAETEHDEQDEGEDDEDDIEYDQGDEGEGDDEYEYDLENHHEAELDEFDEGHPCEDDHCDSEIHQSSTYSKIPKSYRGMEDVGEFDQSLRFGNGTEHGHDDYVYGSEISVIASEISDFGSLDEFGGAQNTHGTVQSDGHRRHEAAEDFEELEYIDNISDHSAAASFLEEVGRHEEKNSGSTQDSEEMGLAGNYDGSEDLEDATTFEGF